MLGRTFSLLALAGALLFAIAAPATSAVVGTCTAEAGWPAADTSLAGEVTALVNQHRAGIGLAQLATSPTLTRIAEWKSRHMAQFGYFSHSDANVPQTGSTRSTADRFETCGYTNAGWGENIAYGYASATAVMQGWLASPGHRANIESASFRAIGVGVARRANGSIEWTQTFGTVVDSTVAPSPAPTPSPGPAPPTAPPAGPGDPPAPDGGEPPPAPAAADPGTAASALVVTGFTARAARARAGHRFQAWLAARPTRGVGRARAICAARAGDSIPSLLAARVLRRGGVLIVRCSWRLPGGSAGEQLVARIGVATPQGTAQLRFRARVRD